jgi:CubicO group peptidase (beta-lactamase class C family)
MKTLCSLFVVVILFGTVYGQKSGKQNGDNNLSDVRLALTEYFQKAGGFGFSGAVLVSQRGRVLLRDGYGWADVRKRIPITANSIFDIGSGVKAFTATAIMQLEEQGKLKTTDPITNYFPEVPEDKKQITLHQLLTHTSGLNFDYFYDEAMLEDRAIMRDREKYIRSVLNHPLAFKPGGGRLYSNTAFSLLAIIIENLSGESYEDFVREHLFKPAGMTETGYYVPRDLRRVARGYNDGGMDYGYPWETQWENQKPLWDLKGNGGMLTTVEDVLKWMTAIRDNRLVSQSTGNKMLQMYYPDQAYGWNVSERDGKRYVWRAGDAVPQAWNVEFRWYKDDDLIAVVLTNKRVRAGSIRRYAMPDLVNITLFNKPPILPRFIVVRESSLKKFEGTYGLDSGARFHIRGDKAAIGGSKSRPILTISGEGQQAIDLLFSGNQTPGLSKLSLELNDKTKNYIEALRANDLVALKAIPAEQSNAQADLQDWIKFVRQNGPLESVEVLGSSPLNQAGVQTFVQLKFPKVYDYYHVTWRDQKLHVQDEDRLQPRVGTFLRKSFTTSPLNLAFLPESANDFATYDPFKGRTIKITFGKNNLIVHTKDGDVVAKKVGGACKKFS